LEAKVPVVPAVVINSEKVLSTFLTFRRRPVVYVVFGEPIIPEGDPNSPLALRTLTRKMMVGIAELLPPERRGYYATPHVVASEEESESSSITAEKK
jgi:1-acyl-sn-glycerol-3-phosphate acyltransferase